MGAGTGAGFLCVLRALSGVGPAEPAARPAPGEPRDLRAHVRRALGRARPRARAQRDGGCPAGPLPAPCRWPRARVCAPPERRTRSATLGGCAPTPPGDAAQAARVVDPAEARVCPQRLLWP